MAKDDDGVVWERLIVGRARARFIIKCWMIKYLLTWKFCLHQKALTNFTYLPFSRVYVYKFQLRVRDTISSLTTQLSNAQQKKRKDVKYFFILRLSKQV